MILALIFSGALWAQEENTSRLPPVVVSAPQQWSESRDELSGERWSNRGSTVENALAPISGLSFSQNGGPGQPRSVLIRGARAEDTLALFNGIPLNDPLSPSRSFDFSQLPMGNIEKVEVIKGPQSVLYGSDAQGGVIHFYGRENAENPSLRVEAGSFETYSASGAWQGLGFGYLQSKGFSAADENEGNLERDTSKSWNVNAAKNFLLNPSSSIKLSGLYHQSKTDTDRNGGRGGDSTGTKAKGDQFLFQAEGQHQIDDQWKVIPIASIFYREREDNTISLVSYSARQMRLAARAEYERERFKQKIGWQSEQETGQATEIQGSKKNTSHALFSHSSYAWEKWELDGGVRAHQESNRFLSWNLGVRYWIAPYLAWKANGAIGSKRPSLYQLHSSYGNSKLVSSRSTSKETSLQWLSEDLLSDLTFFETETKNLIDFDLLSSRYANIGRAQNRGIEFSSQWLGRDFELQQSFTRLWSIDKTTGLRLYRRPLYQWSQEVAVIPDAKWRASLGGRLVGQREDVHPQLFTRQKMPSFYVLHSILSYSWEKSKKLELRAENLANRRYQETSGFGTPGRSFYLSFETSL